LLAPAAPPILLGSRYRGFTRAVYEEEEGLPFMIRVKVRSNESVEQMVRRFKKLCEKEGLNRDIKRTSYYEKPSERRRRKVRKSIKRISRDAD
jgi:small subunit ribosomal protein S21